MLVRLTAGDVAGASVRVDSNTTALPVSGDRTAAGDTPYTLTLGDGTTNLGSGSNVVYDINWGDGSPNTSITAGELAAQDDQVTHTYTAAATATIAVDLVVYGVDYGTVGGQSVTVDMTDATTTMLSVGPSSPSFGQIVTLTATVAAVTPATGTPGGTVEFYDGTMDLGPGTLDSGTLMATLVTPPLTVRDHAFTAVYSGDGTFTASTSAAATVSVSYPVTAGGLTLSGSPTGAEGYTLDLPQDDPNSNPIEQWTIDWGDGVVANVSGNPTSETHQYGNGGQDYTITAIAASSAGNFQATLPVSIADVAPSGLVVTASATDYTGADDVTISGTFTNNSPQESLGVSIDWGDGSPPTTFGLAPGATSFEYPAQQYLRSGQYPISVTVTDADSSSTSNGVTVNYANVAPSGLSLSLDQSTIDEGDQVNLSGSFTDPQSNLTHAVTIDWGDGGGQPDTTTMSLDAGETSFEADPHTYATPGNYTIQVILAGPDGSTTAATPVTVNAVLPQISLVADIPTASESSASAADFTLTRTVESDADLDNALTVQYSVDAGSTAAAGTDYAPLPGSGSVTFAAGSATATIPVSPLDAGKVGGSVALTLGLAAGGNYVIDSDNPSATVTIYDDDLPTVTLATTVPNATESGSAGKFTVKLANGVTLDHDLLVRYTLGGSAVNGDDYRMLSGDVIIPAGAASATISIKPIDVALANGSQTVILTLAPAPITTSATTPRMTRAP